MDQVTHREKLTGVKVGFLEETLDDGGDRMMEIWKN